MSKNIIHNSLKNQPNEKGRFGIYGGMFVAETLMPLITNVTSAYNKIKDTNSFKKKTCLLSKTLYWPTLSFIFCRKDNQLL